ncbi:MAG: quinolinate synthase NadA [Candidatus Dormibacteria bacterium]
MPATALGPPRKELLREIDRLRRERNAVLLAHNYQAPEVQDVADYVGDSLGLSRQAAASEAEVIVFCGVHFMAETAAVLSPGKTVLLPDLEAGCSLAATIDAQQLRDWKAEHPGAVVVSYVNTTAEVKAETDICCTSGNAEAVIRSIPEDREILFLPDMFLGAHLQRVTGRRLNIWAGECHVHAGIHQEDVDRVQREHPGAELLVHPECGCSTPWLYYASTEGRENVHVLSTEGMVRHAQSSGASQFIVATEVGILHRMRLANPQKMFLPASEDAVCRFMKTITLEKVHAALRDLVHVITVPDDIADRARGSIERMVAIG